MKKSQNAQIYARAMFELAKEQQKMEQVLSELKLFLRLQEEEPRLKTFLKLPFFTDDVKFQFMDNLSRLKISDMTIKFIKILFSKNYLDMFPKIVSIYEEMTDQEMQRKRVLVISSIPLEPSYVKQLAQLLELYLKQKAVIQNIVQPEIIGGIILQLEDVCIDASIKGKLDKLRKQLLSTKAHSLKNVFDASGWPVIPGVQ